MDESTHIDPLLGTAVGGRYLLREAVAEGARWRRYIAELDGRRLLVTVISSHALDDAAVERFSDRCGRYSAIAHPRLAALIDFGRDPEGDLFIVESGEVWHDLAHEIALKGALRPAHAVRLTLQLLAGVDALHEARVIHGGICPSMLRLAVDADGRSSLQVAPLGVALEAARPGDDEETARYQPPDTRSGIASDLFAVARTLMVLLTGEDRDFTAAEEALGKRHEVLPSGLSEALGRALGGDDPFVSAADMASVLSGGGDRPRFGRYTLLHRLARGGMGEIFLARAEGIEGIEGTSRLCVIKTIRTNLASDPDLIQRFVGEVRVLASLAHGNIVPVYDVGRVGDAFYIAMEYVPGKDLHQLLRRVREGGQRIPLPLALFIARELAKGLAYAHRPRSVGGPELVHRDVSPQNTLISYAGEVKLIDFGLALDGHGRTPTREGVVLGKLCYISPEQARAETLDQRTDIYSLGLVFFEMLTGEVFFNQPTVDEVMQHVPNPMVEAPSKRQPDIPRDVDEICLRAMAPRREDRYASVSEFRDDLSAAIARLAPRTNPEEVGALVARFFPNAAEEDEQLVSDLSGTLPVLNEGFSRAAEDRATRSASEVAAVSVLAPDRAPIAMASALISVESLSGAAADPQEMETAPSVFSGRDVQDDLTKPQGRKDAEGGEAPVAEVHGIPDEELEKEVAAWRRSHDISRFPLGRLVLLFALVVVFLGSGVAVLLYRHAMTRRMNSERLHLDHVRRPALNVKARGVTPLGSLRPSKASLRTSVVNSGRAPEPSRAFCYLDFSGGKAGMTIVVDGKLRGKIPLSAPIPLQAGKKHSVVVSYPHYRPQRMTPECKAFETYEYELKVFHRRRP